MMCALQVAMILHRNIHAHTYICIYINERMFSCMFICICKFRMLSVNGEHHYISCEYMFKTTKYIQTYTLRTFIKADSM